MSTIRTLKQIYKNLLASLPVGDKAQIVFNTDSQGNPTFEKSDGTTILDLLESSAGTSSGIPGVRSVSTNDYTVTVAGSSKVAKIVDPGFVVTAKQIIGAFYYNAAGTRVSIPLTAVTVAANGSDYDVTFTDLDANFAGTEDVEIYAATTPRAYDLLADLMLHARANPEWERYLPGIIADVTNGAAATYDYSIDCRGYNHVSIKGELTDSPVVKVYATNEDVDYGDVSSWEDVSTLILGAATKIADFITSDSAGIIGGYTWLKVEVVSAAGTEDWYLTSLLWYA